MAPDNAVNPSTAAAATLPNGPKFFNTLLVASPKFFNPYSYFVKPVLVSNNAELNPLSASFPDFYASL